MANRVIVAAFDTQNQAYDTATALQRLHDDGTITVKQGALVTKDDKGNLAVPDTRDVGPPWGLLGGGVIGGIMGVLLGPAGVAAGAAAGTVAAAAAAGAAIGTATGATVGAAADLLGLGLSEEYVNQEMSSTLNPGDSALIVEADEGSTEPVDAAVTRNHGRVYRKDLS